MTTPTWADDPFADPLPPIPDVPYMIGIPGNLGAVHAVPHSRAIWAAEHGDNDTTRTPVAAECGTIVMLARRWGAFNRGNERIRAAGACLRCAWTIAIDQNTIDAELALLVPTTAEQRVLERFQPEPLMVHRLAERILSARDAEEEYDRDHSRWAEHLAHITRHNPAVLLRDEACAYGECEHDDDTDCYQGAGVACPTCSIRAGSWAGEYEGQYDMPVPAPCSVLTAAVKFHGVEVRW